MLVLGKNWLSTSKALVNKYIGASSNWGKNPEPASRPVFRSGSLKRIERIMQVCHRIIPLTACALSVLVMSCRTTDPIEEPQSTSTAADTSPKTRYSEEHEQSLKEIFVLADQGRWGEAEQRTASLHAAHPDDPTVTRVHNWVQTQGQQLRDRAVEDRIREIDARHSPFNPTVKSLITEKKDRGLPPRQDVRDVVEQIESAPYVPESYGKVIIKKGPLFEIETPEGRMAKVLEKEVSVHLDNVTLETIIFNIGQSEGINFVADKALPAFKQNLSVRMDKVKLSEFLNYVSRNFDVQFQVGADLIWIVDAKDPTRIQEETRFYRLRKGFIIPAAFGAEEVTRVKVTAPNNVTTVTENEKINKFVNDNAPQTPAIETAIKDFFHGSKYMIDYERNLIVARGTREQLEALERIIEEFDKPIQQVLIEARFITVSEAAFLQLGVSWETGRNLLAAGRTPTDFT
jgi:type IV pilus assembly protein PilQ